MTGLRLEPKGACDTTSKNVTRCGACVHAQGDVHFVRVHVIALVVDVVCLMLVLSSRVVVHAVVVAFP